MKITACDLDEQTPAKTYTIAIEGDAPVDLDLCETHAAPIEELIRQVKVAGGVIQGKGEPGPVVPKRGVARRAAAKKAAPAKRVASKGRRAPKITTLEEIEAQKRARG
ncbi:hypothetical protein ACWD7Y_12475 [Streptomyces drozdowiczii]